MNRQYPNQPNLIARFLNHNVTIILGDRTVIVGILQETTNYELVINNTIIMKHAITSIKET